MSDIDDKIIYMLIAKNEKPLVEYSYFTGTFNQVCLNYLKKIEPNSSKALKIDDFMLFYIITLTRASVDVNQRATDCATTP